MATTSSSWKPIPAVRGINFALRAVEWVRPMARFTEEAVLAEARKRTVLHDLGDERFLVPLNKLLEDYAADETLTPLGKLISWTSLVHHTSNRMRVHQEFRAHPEIAEQRITRPLFVIGLPRTGTTLLYGLLSQNENFRPLWCWESMSPAPLGPLLPNQPDPRKQRAEKTIGGLHKLAPELKKIHEFDPKGPEECLGLLYNTFVTPFFRGELPRYRRWLSEIPESEVDQAYVEYRDQLKLLQWQQPGNWVLKCPSHLFGLSSLLKAFPDANVIQTHRDPIESIPSLCSLSATMESIVSRNVDAKAIGRRTLETLDLILERSMQARENHGQNGFFDLRFEELVAQPLESVERICDSFQLELTPSVRRRMENYLIENRRHKHGTHSYSLADFDLSANEIRSQLDRYYHRFDVSSN